MRTDVKVGLVCVLILVIAVVSYFAMQGKPKEPLQTQTNRSANTSAIPASASPVSPATPADSTPGSGSVAVSPPASVTPAGSLTSASPAATTMASPPVGYSIVPTVGQTPSIYSPPSSPTGSSTTAPTGGSALYPPGVSTHTLLPAVGGSTTGPGLTGGLPQEPSLPGVGVRPGQVETGMRPGDSLLEPGATRTPSGTHIPGGYIPTRTPGLTGGITSGAAAGTYSVQNGDNLTSIAKKNHTTVSAIKAANPTINPDRLKIKQVINLPAAGTGSSLVTSTATTRPSRSSARPAATGSRAVTGARTAIKPGSSYKVRKGDTLRKISKAAYGDEKLWRRLFRVNRGELASANDLEPGMVLKIPAR